MLTFALPAMLAVVLVAGTAVPLRAQTPPAPPPDANAVPQTVPPGAQPDTAPAACGQRLESIIRSVTDRFEGAPLKSEAQRQAYDAFMSAAAKAREFVREACANERSAANVKQIESAEKQIGEALTALRPALENFYSSLSDEQKEQLNSLSRQLQAQAKDWWRDFAREIGRQMHGPQSRVPDGPGRLHFCIGKFCVPVPEEFAGPPRNERAPEPPPVEEDRI